MLLLHGFPDTPHTWAIAQERLAAAGFYSVAPFMRGYPPTEAPLNGDYSAAQLGRDVVELIAALGRTQATVVGHDWGALAAYAASSLAPERIAKLVVLSIPHPGTLGLSLKTLWKARHFLTFQFRSATIRRLTRDNFQGIEAIYRRWSPGWAFTEKDLQPIRDCFAAPGGLAGALGYYWSFWPNALLPWRPVRRILQRVTTIPTLALFGEADRALSRAGLDRTRAWFSAAYEIVRIPRAGHFVHREASELFCSMLLGFIGTNAS